MLIDLMIESEGFTDEMIADNALTFLFAGHDTTAHTMSYTIYELYKNPSALHQVRQEIDTVLGDQQIASSEQLSSLENVEKAIKVSWFDIFVLQLFGGLIIMIYPNRKRLEFIQ